MVPDTTAKAESAKGKAEGGLASMMNFVPSAYYDLIARVCPGMAFWVALSYKTPVLSGPDQTAALEGLSGPMIFLLVILSYVSGIVLTGFSLVWDWLSLRIFMLNSKTKVHLGLNVGIEESFTDKWKRISNHIDDVIKVDDGAGRVLVKAMAEVTLCQNLLSGLGVLGFIGWLSEGARFFNPVTYHDFYWPIALALFLSMMFRQAMFLGRVKDLHRLYVSDPLGLPEID